MPQARRVKLNEPRVLEWARRTAGYTPEDVAKSVGTRPENVEKWERGEAAPTFRQLEEFANKVKRPLTVLLLPEVPNDLPDPEDFRTLLHAQTQPFSPRTLLALRQLRNGLDDLRELLSELHRTLSFDLPQYRQGGDPTAAAEHLRRDLGVPLKTQIDWRDAYEALGAWREVLFGRGVLTQVFTMPMADARAFSAIDGDLAGIGLNTNDRGAGRIFSLFHEVAHLCLRRPGVSGESPPNGDAPATPHAGVERYCERFAAAFLLPQNDPLVTAYLRAARDSFTSSPMSALSRKLKVSRYALAYRMVDMGLISYTACREETRKWQAEDRMRATKESAGFARPSVKRVSALGKPFLRLVFDAWEEGVVNEVDVGRLLSLKPKHFDEVASSLG